MSRTKKQAPARTPEGRENQLVNLATELAEKQLRDGTASAAVITHYLKLGTEQEKLKASKLQEEVEFLRTKTETVKNASDKEELYQAALGAMKKYSSGE